MRKVEGVSQNQTNKVEENYKDGKITRRRHLAELAGAGTALLSTASKAEQPLESRDAAELKSQRLENDPHFTKFSDEEVIFPEKPQPLDIKARNFIEKFIPLQNQALDALGMRAVGGRDITVGLQVNIAANTEQIFARQWELLRDFLNISGNYSLTDFNYALAYLLPPFLAKYGIFVKGSLTQLADNGPGIILKDYMSVGFFKIDSVSRGEAEVLGKRFTRDVVSINKLNNFPEQAYLQNFDMGFGGEHLYQNAVLLNYLKRKGIADLSNAKRKAEQYKNIPLQEVMRRIADTGDPKARATFYAHNKILNDHPIEVLVESDFQRTIDHETGHVYFSKTFLKLFSAPKTDQTKDSYIFAANSSVHNEITAVLIEFQNRKTRPISLLGQIEILNQPKNYDFVHPQAADWLIGRFINIIKSHPKKYGFAIDSSIAVAVENQIMVQIPALLARPELFDEILEKTIKIHEDNMGQDFSAKYYQFRKLPVPPDLPNTQLVEADVKKEIEFPWVETGVVVSAAGSLTAAAILRNRLKQRRQMVEAEESLRKELRGIRGQKIDAKKLISDLQLGVKGSVNELARQNALARLFELGKQNNKIAGAAGFLDRRLTKKKKNEAERQ